MNLQELKRYYTGNIEATLSQENMNNWTIKEDLTKPTWLWNTEYWTGSTNIENGQNHVRWYKGNNDFTNAYSHWSDQACGVRPVIIF